MKRILYLLILISFQQVFAADYYFSSHSGNDLNNGSTSSTAWQSLDSLYVLIDDSRLAGGDVVYLERGSVWYEVEMLDFQSLSGSSGNYIQFTTFGSGDMPILSGGKILGAHTTTDGNIYIYVDSDIPGPDYDAVTSRGRRFLSSVIIDGVRRPTSVHPNDTFLYASDVDNYSLEDAGQNWTPGEWVGGWISCRFDKWHWTAARVLNSYTYTLTTSGFDTIVFSFPNNSEVYYQFLNAYAACDSQDEWYSNDDTLAVYSATGAPSSVLVSVKDTAVNLEDSDYIRFDSIHFKDFNMFGIHNKRGDSIKTNASIFDGIGHCGVFNWGAISDTPGAGDTDGASVTNSEFSDCLLNSILFKYCHGGIATNNWIHRNGIHNGYQNIATTDYPHGAHNYAISFTNNLGDPGAGLVQYNFFDSIGAGAIMLHYEQDPITVPDNLIRNYGMSEMGDLAAIYGVSDPTSGTQVRADNNIIINAFNIQYTIDSLVDYGAANNKFVDRFTHAVYFDQDTYNYKGDSNSIEDCNVAWFTNGGKNRSFKYNNILRPNKVGMHPYHANMIHNSYSIPLVSGTSEADTVRYNTIVINDSTTNGYTFHRQSGGYSNCNFPCDGMVDDNDYFDPTSSLQYVGATFVSGSPVVTETTMPGWAARTIPCICGTGDPGNNSTLDNTAFTRIYLLKNFDDDPWSAPIAGGNWEYKDGSSVGSTVTVPPFYSVFIFTEDVSPVTINDLNIDSALIPMLESTPIVSPPEVPLDTFWYWMADTTYKSAPDTSTACADSAVIFESAFESGGSVIDTIAKVNMCYSSSGDEAGWTSVYSITDPDSVEIATDVYFINSGHLAGGANGEWTTIWPPYVGYHYHFLPNTDNDPRFYTIRGSGLDETAYYALLFVTSRDDASVSPPRPGYFYSQSKGDTVESVGNVDTWAVIDSLQATGDSIRFSVDRLNSQYGYFNGLVLVEKTYTAPSYDTNQAYVVWNDADFGSGNGYDSAYVRIQSNNPVSTVITRTSLVGDTIANVSFSGTGCQTQKVALSSTITGESDLYATVDSLGTYVYIVFESAEEVSPTELPDWHFKIPTTFRINPGKAIRFKPYGNY
jgi:hypothetical protein